MGWLEAFCFSCYYLMSRDSHATAWFPDSCLRIPPFIGGNLELNLRKSTSINRWVPLRSERLTCLRNATAIAWMCQASAKRHVFSVCWSHGSIFYLFLKSQLKARMANCISLLCFFFLISRVLSFQNSCSNCSDLFIPCFTNSRVAK